MPQQLSDGSWHLSVEGRTQIAPHDAVWLVETETPAPKEMVPAEMPVPLSITLPAGGRIEGEVIESLISQSDIWLHWRRGGRKRTLWISAAAVAGFEIVMRQPKQSVAAGGVAANGQAEKLPLLHSAADLDAYLAAELQTDGHALKHHFHADLQAWERCSDDARNADVTFRLAQRLGLPLIDLAAVQAAEPALPALTPEMARKFRMVPLRIRQNLIAVATDNPTNLEAVSTVEFTTGRRVVLLLAKPAAVHAAISRHYDRVEDTALLKSLILSPDSDDDSEKSVHENERLAREQPIVRLVASLIEDAARRRASDIHIRPRAEDFEVLFRVDGALLPVRTFAKPLLRAVTSRIKVLAGMDIAEHRLPQDGRVSVPFEDTEIDMRISVLPSVNGESVVMRLLNPRDGLRNLTEIGFSVHDEAVFRDMLARSHGMILVTGPTGCGKSTTLYAALLEARKEDVNIITVEDPVEYHIPDVTQIQINHAIGFDFARTLRNILRHDPDVIMLGEIRDHETAEIAVESALTGHLVLSTLHTNSAATAVTRLLDLGVESFLLASTLLGVLAQRLARRNCHQCMEPERIDPFVRAALGVGEDETFYRGIGCRHCSGTGVHGRTAVYELMPITPAIRKLIVPNVDGDAVHAEAIAAGMVSITDQAIALARAGVISLDEAYRIRVE
jgi:type IV pilus assembly protein PilB